ncbi:MAG TPA: helix-hairpin-helix domain-containing protein [Candidatus Eremiobacteraceae bacterium]|nr:helix-hairpin-helix domain-containing protein [Candidatus Eremiobacteraceae bacterium]
MDRSPLVKIVAGSAAAVALIALGTLLPKPPTAGAPSLAPIDSFTAPGVAASADPEPSQPSASPSGPLHVYVCGAVRKAGVYVMPAGSRVVDAIDKAGGASGNSDVEQLNLAEPLADGMKVEIPVKGQMLTAPVESMGISRSDSLSGARGARGGRHSSSRGGSHKLSAGQTVNINTASESELAQLPGVGPSLARRIVEYRTANGPFQMPDDLQNVSGIGANKFAKMEPFIRI